MLGTYGTLLDVVNDVYINAGPVNGLFGLGLHFYHPLVCAMEVSKGTVKELWGEADSVSFQENISLDGQLIQGNPEVSGNPWDLLEALWPYP